MSSSLVIPKSSETIISYHIEHESHKLLSHLSDQKIKLFKELLASVEPASRWNITGPVIQSRECDIYRAGASSLNLTLAIKDYHPGASRATPEQQFSALERCHPAMTDLSPQLKVPKVFLVNAQHRLLVMEWIDGTSLLHHLWNPFNKKQLLTDRLHHVGAWLRKYHDLSQPESSQTKLKDLLKPFNKNNSNPEGFYLSRSVFFQSVLEFFQGLEEEGTMLPTIDTIVHGDFTPANMLLADQKVYGLDIWGTMRRPIYHDVCRMIVYLGVAYPFYMVENLFTKQSLLTSKITCFIEGYGTDRLNPLSATFKIFLLIELLRRWRVIASRQDNLVTSVTNYYQLKRIEQQAKLLMPLI